MNQFIATYVNATNDPSGNPRRGWKMHSFDGTFLTFVDEGFEGKQAVYSVGFLRDDVIFLAGEYRITPTEYRTLKANEAISVTSHKINV